jgi:FdrA protein
MQRIEILRSTYLDSVSLMRISGVAAEAPGVTNAVVAMATDTNLALMRDTGFDLAPAGKVSANDLVIAIEAGDRPALDEALARVKSEIRGRPRHRRAEEAASPSSIESAVRDYPEIDLVLISVPGPYAAYEAHKALSQERHVMIFSDNVTVEDECRLKTLGRPSGLLVMGPDCGTAMIGGTALGFANRVRKGTVGLVSASGTGAQEVSSILSRLGVGISHIIGTGGRDVSGRVGGITMIMGLKALAEDDATRVIVVISKAPDEQVARQVLSTAAGTGKPCIVYFAGRGARPDQANFVFTSTLTETARAAASAAGGPLDAGMLEDRSLKMRARAVRNDLPAARRYLRGLFSGGTLAQETAFIIGDSLGPLRTNMNIDGLEHMSDPSLSDGHTILDMGDDTFTRGRAHPMIDQAYRLNRLAREMRDPDTGVVLMDVVLGYGCNSNPAGEIAAALRRLRDRGDAAASLPPVIASICGTPGDPQGYGRQREALESEGVLVAPTNAVASELVLDILGGNRIG